MRSTWRRNRRYLGLGTGGGGRGGGEEDGGEGDRLVLPVGQMTGTVISKDMFAQTTLPHLSQACKHLSCLCVWLVLVEADEECVCVCFVEILWYKRERGSGGGGGVLDSFPRRTPFPVSPAKKAERTIRKTALRNLVESSSDEAHPILKQTVLPTVHKTTCHRYIRVESGAHVFLAGALISPPTHTLAPASLLLELVEQVHDGLRRVAGVRDLAVAGHRGRAEREPEERSLEVLLQLAAEEQVGRKLRACVSWRTEWGSKGEGKRDKRR